MRNSYEIMRDLLMSAEGTHATKICETTNINYAKFREYMDPFVKKGYVSKEHHGRCIYTITDKGRDLVRQFDELAKALK